MAMIKQHVVKKLQKRLTFTNFDDSKTKVSAKCRKIFMSAILYP